jgi:hypothetical protein
MQFEVQFSQRFENIKSEVLKNQVLKMETEIGAKISGNCAELPCQFSKYLYSTRECKLQKIKNILTKYYHYPDNHSYYTKTGLHDV